MLPADGRHPVVDGGQRQVRPADRPSGHPQPLERLWRCDLVHEVQVDVEQVGLAGSAPDDVVVPHLVEQGP